MQYLNSPWAVLPSPVILIGRLGTIILIILWFISELSRWKAQGFSVLDLKVRDCRFCYFLLVLHVMDACTDSREPNGKTPTLEARCHDHREEMTSGQLSWRQERRRKRSSWGTWGGGNRWDLSLEQHLGCLQSLWQEDGSPFMLHMLRPQRRPEIFWAVLQSPSDLPSFFMYLAPSERKCRGKLGRALC